MNPIVRKYQIESSRIPKKYLTPPKRKDGEPGMIVPPNDKEAYDKLMEINNRVVEFIKNGNNLFLFSKYCGNGKTTWACAIALNYINVYASDHPIDTPVLYLNASDYINKRKAAISNPELLQEIIELEKGIRKARLVIWDDVATKTLSEYDMEQLYTFINYRNSECLSNIFTSNCNADELTVIMGMRLASRIINDSINIEFLNKSDFRKGGGFNFDTVANS